jgi:hypothetical protein
MVDEVIVIGEEQQVADSFASCSEIHLTIEFRHDHRSARHGRNHRFSRFLTIVAW